MVGRDRFRHQKSGELSDVEWKNKSLLTGCEGIRKILRTDASVFGRGVGEGEVFQGLRGGAAVETKQREILDTALEVFARDGFRNTDVQIIADLAGVGKGTVYRHFGNKEQLFLATSRYCTEMLREYVEQKVLTGQDVSDLEQQGNLPELLRKIALACAEFYQSHPQTVEMMIIERAEFRETVYPTHLIFREESRDRFDALIRSGMERGELRTGNVQEVSDTFGDLIHGCVVNGCLGGGKKQLVDRVQQAVELLLTGMVVPEKNAGKAKSSKRTRMS